MDGGTLHPWMEVLYTRGWRYCTPVDGWCCLYHPSMGGVVCTTRRWVTVQCTATRRWVTVQCTATRRWVDGTVYTHSTGGWMAPYTHIRRVGGTGTRDHAYTGVPWVYTFGCTGTPPVDGCRSCCAGRSRRTQTPRRNCPPG